MFFFPKRNVMRTESLSEERKKIQKKKKKKGIIQVQCVKEMKRNKKNKGRGKPQVKTGKVGEVNE